MPLPFDAVVVAYFAASGSLLFLLRAPLRRLDNPGSTGFVVALVAISVWPLALGINYLVPDLRVSMALWNFRILAAGLVSIGWFLVAYEYTTQQLPPKAYLGGLGGYLVVGQLICWTNPAHRLLLGPETSVRGGILLPDLGPWFWVQTTINYALIVAATALLAVEWSQSNGLHRKQSALLTLAVVPPIVANVLTITEAVTTIHDLTPFGLVGSGLVLSLALYRLDVLEIAPIARKTVVEEMRDAVLIVDECGAILDCNRTARALFDVREGEYGKPVAEVFADRPELERTISSEDQTEREVATTVDGERRHFSLTVSGIPLGSRRAAPRAQAVVLRDITRRKRRERELRDSKAELELVRQLMSLILRHNLRNKLTVSQGYTEMLAERYPDDDFRELRTVNEELLSIAEKARDMEAVVGSDAVGIHDLTAIVRRVVARIEPRYPDATVEVTAAERRRVECLAGVEIAVENLVENAAEHGGSNPRVHISVRETDEGAVSLRVRDDGPGIPDAELEVLESRRETLLSHGSGIGLWLVTWWADKSDVAVSFEADGGGTTVTIPFDAASTDDVASATR